MSKDTTTRPGRLVRNARFGIARRSLAALATIGALALVGAGGGDEGSSSSGGGDTTTSAQEPFTIGFMVPTQKMQFFIEQIDEMEKLAEAAGGKIVVGDPDNDPVKQLQIAQTWINGGEVDAIAGMPLDINAFQSVMDEAAEKQIPVIPWGATAKKLHPGQFTINNDFKLWGLEAGAAMARCIDVRLGGRAEVMILGGPNIPGAIVEDRIAGLKEGLLDNAPGAKIVAEQNGENNQLTSTQLTETILQAHPNVTAFGATGDDSMIGILKALENAGKDPTRLCLIGMDGVAEGEAAFDAGKFYAEGDLNMKGVRETTVAGTKALLADINDPEYSQQAVRIKVKTKTQP